MRRSFFSLRFGVPVAGESTTKTKFAARRRNALNSSPESKHRRKGNPFIMALTSAQRKQLRSLAHNLDAVIIIGKQGVTDSLVRAIAEALEAHELIKVRFNEFKDDKKELIEEISFRTNCQVVGTIGHVATLFKYQEDEEKRKIEI